MNFQDIVIPKIKSSHIPCLHPWLFNFVHPDGSVTCCTQNHIKIGNLNYNSQEAIWNSIPIQNIRKKISSGDYLNAGCDSECPFLRGSFDKVLKAPPPSEQILPEIDYFEDKLSSYGININNVKEDYLNQKILVKGMPVFVDFLWNEKCNAACVHCNQDHNSPLKISEEIIKKIPKLIRHTNYLRFQGGEVYADERFRPFLQKLLKIRSHENFKIYIITNGSYLNDRVISDFLINPKKIKILLSIDSVVKEKFKVIRKNLRFERIVNVIKKLSKLEKEVNLRLTVNYCVMKSNIDELNLACDFALANNIKINFAAIQHNFGNQNFFYSNSEELKIIREKISSVKKYAESINCKVSGFEGLLKRIDIAISGTGYIKTSNIYNLRNSVINKIFKIFTIK